MKFTREQKGRYHFKGIDSWNGKEMEGHILYQPYDVPLSQVWKVVFGLDTKDQYTAHYAKSLKECKRWLTF